jgi:Ca2+/Na+ antiporter
MKNAVFCDVAPCRSCVSRRFGGTYRLHFQSRKIRERGTSVSRWHCSVTCSRWFLARGSTRRHTPEDGIIYIYIYIYIYVFIFVFTGTLQVETKESPHIIKICHENNFQQFTIRSSFSLKLQLMIQILVTYTSGIHLTVNNKLHPPCV